MAKFLTTVGNSYHIEQIILEAKENLVLVTPYLKLSRNLIERITEADRKGIKITVVYGKSDIAKQERDVLYALKNIRIYFCDHLHAKCYHNDETMIITSMNLYEFSERNNREMGIALEKVVDGEIFTKAKEEIESIINISRLDKAFGGNVQPVVEQQKPIQKESTGDNNHKETVKGINQIGAPEYRFITELGKKLKEKYPDSAITIDRRLTVNNFPKKGITLIADGRIDFKFENPLIYDVAQRLNKTLTVKEYRGLRFYWNHNVLNIYNEKNFEICNDWSSVKFMVEKYMRIIEVVSEKLKI